MTPLELFNAHKRWAYKIAYTSRWAMDPDARTQAALIGLWTACLNYDPDKGDRMPWYSTLYITTSIRRACLADHSKIVPDCPTASLPDPESSAITAEEMARQRDRIMRHLTKGRRKVLEAILSGKSQAETGILLGISRQRVNQVLHELRAAVENEP